MRKTKDKQHLAATAKRWTLRLNRDMASPVYKEAWRGQQCLFCQFYDPLSSAMGQDFGACTNALSPFDRTVMFEQAVSRSLLKFEAATL